MSYQAGDVGFSTSRGLIPWAIRWAQMRKYGSTSTAARWNHCFVMVGPTQLVEATGKGVVLGDLGGYADQEYAIYRPPYVALEDATKAADFATRMLGDKYNYLEAVGLALMFLTGTRLRFGLAGTMICSGLAATSCELGGIFMGPDAAYDSPADVMSTAQTQGWKRIQESVS